MAEKTKDVGVRNLRLTGSGETSGMGAYNPVDYPEAWDLCILGSIVLPGISKIEIERSMSLDVLTAPAQDGANVIISGAPPAKVTITNIIGLREHWVDLNLVLPTLETAARARRDARTPYAYALSHPLASLRNVAAVIIETIKGPVQSGPGGIWTTTLSCYEMRPPLKRAAVPKPITLGANQSAANPPGPPKPPSQAKAPKP